MSTIHTILQQFRSLSHDELQKGKLFERMMAQFLRTDPQYANRLDAVWMWNEWPVLACCCENSNGQLRGRLILFADRRGRVMHRLITWFVQASPELR